MGSPCHLESSASQLFYKSKDSPEYAALCVSAHLPHPQRSLVATFVQNAHEPGVAAELLLRDKSKLEEFLVDWTHVINRVHPVLAENLNATQRQQILQRDNNRCSITEATSEDLVIASVLPPDLFDDPEFVEQGRLYEIFKAYIGGSDLQAVQTVFNSDQRWSERYITLSREVFNHFKDGRVSLKCLSMDSKTSIRCIVNPHYFDSSTKFAPQKYTATIENRLPETTKLVGRELLHVNHRFAEAIGCLKVQEYMKQTRLLPAELELSTQSWLEKVAAYVVQLIRPLWIQVPVSIRAATYRTLVAAGLRQYDSTLSRRTFRLPFGLYLRIGVAEWGPKHQAEYETLRLVNKYTQIPAPKPIDVFQDSRNSYLVMTRLPGQPVGQVLNFMSDQQIENMVLKLKEYVHELREIQNETKVGFQICNSIGGGILDWRIGDSQRENLRFKNEAEFHDFLTRDVSTDVKEKAAASHKVEHEVVFTHADLNPRNILVDERGRITGIVDWECAGWYPEYWEYTKAHFGVRYTIRWLADVVDQVFPNYRQELYVENMLSDLAPGW